MSTKKNLFSVWFNLQVGLARTVDPFMVLAVN